MEWSFAPVLGNIELLLLGLLSTLKITGIALAFGVPLGLALALSRLSVVRPVSVVAVSTRRSRRESRGIPFAVIRWAKATCRNRTRFGDGHQSDAV